MLEGLKEAGKKFKACLVTNTHTTQMPYKGIRILDATNSNYGKLLAKIKSKMDKLDDADWWLSPAQKADKYAIKTTEVAKHIGALGMSHTTFVLCLLHSTIIYEPCIMLASQHHNIRRIKSNVVSRRATSCDIWCTTHRVHLGV